MEVRELMAHPVQLVAAAVSDERERTHAYFNLILKVCVQRRKPLTNPRSSAAELPLPGLPIASPVCPETT